MFGAKTQTKTTTAPAAATTTKPSGTTYDVCQPSTKEGKKFEHIATLFIRENKTGGVLYAKDADGKEVQYAVFARTKKPGSAPKQEAAPVQAA